MPTVILWSAPRSRSTAFLRSMIERGDLLALHEPMETLAYVGPIEVAGNSLTALFEFLDWLVAGPHLNTVFVKETLNQPVLDAVVAHDRALSQLRHTFLLRRPEEIAASFFALEHDMRIQETGVEALHALYSVVSETDGPAPVVVDSDDLVHHPEATMAAYCRAVGLPFLPEALNWQSGQRPEWSGASRWHVDTSTSTEFKPPAAADRHGLASHPLVVEFAARHRPSTSSSVHIDSTSTGRKPENGSSQSLRGSKYFASCPRALTGWPRPPVVLGRSADPVLTRLPTLRFQQLQPIDSWRQDGSGLIRLQ